MAMQRRTWIAGGLAAGLSLNWRQSQAESSPPKFDIIDCHTHFYDPARPEGVPWPGKGSALYRTVLPKNLREQKQYLPLTGTVVVEASPRLEDNAWLLDLAANDPFVVGVVGHLDPGQAEFAMHVKRFAANKLFRGIRVSVNLVKSLLEKNELSDFKLLAEHDLALDVNGGPDTPAAIAQLAAKLPELRVALNHIGNVRITKDAPPLDWQTGIRAAAKQSNVYCKISALGEGAARSGETAPTDIEFYRPYVDVVWNAFGDDRVIYGSNWPVSERAADYHTVQRLALEYAQSKGDAAVRKFCALNAGQAYKWIDRPGRRS